MLTVQIDVTQLSHLIRITILEALHEMPQPSAINPCERLTIAQIIEQYKISKSTIHNLTKTGKLAFEKMGRKTLFVREDVERFFNSQKKQLNKSFGNTFKAVTKKKGGTNE